MDNEHFAALAITEGKPHLDCRPLTGDETFAHELVDPKDALARRGYVHAFIGHMTGRDVSSIERERTALVDQVCQRQYSSGILHLSNAMFEYLVDELLWGRICE